MPCGRRALRSVQLVIGHSTLWVSSTADHAHKVIEADWRSKVVEITPTGIKTLGWQFYIIWTVFNASFIPIVFFLYPETAARSLEDIDRFFRENQDIIIFRDKTATSSKRPEAYIEHQENEIRRNSSVISADPKAMERMRQRAAAANRSIGDEEKEAGGFEHDEKL